MYQYYDWSGGTSDLKPNPPDPVYRIHVLFELVADGGEKSPHNFHHVIDEIQHTLDTDATLRELLPQWLVQQFSDLAALVEIETSIKKLGHRRHNMLKEGTKEYRTPGHSIIGQLDQTCDEVFTDKILTDAGVKA